MRKRFFCALCALILALCTPALAGCGKEKLSENAQNYFGWGGDYYKSVESRYTLNYDEMFYDDFTDGIDAKEKWDIADNVWDQYSTHQNGVRPQNLALLNDPENPDTHLLIRANGDYYRGSQVDGMPDAMPLSGGVLSTKRAFGPGRFEVRMKIMPRTGALTSMWLFAWLDEPDTGVYQSEVDIEMGLRPHFDTAYFTTWTSPANNTNRAIPITPKNDGKFHTYTFDWSVDPKQVEYYIDGELTDTIDSNVPDLNATLSLGIWCPTFAGTITSPSAERGGGREFEYGFAEVDYVRCIPFEQRGWRQRTVLNRASNNDYKVPTLTKMPTVNMIANGDFNTVYDELTCYGATYTPAPWAADSDKAAKITELTAGNNAAEIPGSGWLRQIISNSFEGYRYRITGKYRTEGDTRAFVRLSGHKDVYTANIDASSFNQYIFLDASAEWKSFEQEFTVTDKLTKTLLIWLGNNAAEENAPTTSWFDDLTLTFLGCD